MSDIRTQQLRAVVFGNGMGMLPPLMGRFRQFFGEVHFAEPKYPTAYKWFYLFWSVRPGKLAWYRNWKRYMESSPSSFRVWTRACARSLDALHGKFDVILHLGAQNSPGWKPDKPVFIFTDSCRRLSSLNQHDESCAFRHAQEEREWFSLEGDVYRNARRIFVGSQFVKDALVGFYGVPDHRVVVTGFGAGAAFGELVTKQFDGKTILYIGKGDFEKKGGVVLLEAFRKVREEIPDAVLHVVGQHALPMQVEGVVNEGFITDRTKLIALMRAAHVFTLPSLVDRFGIALVEAMATSTPCVTSSYGAMPEVVGDAGLVVPSNDADALAAALIRLLRNEAESREMGLRGRVRFERKYNWDTIWELISSEIRQGLNEAAAGQ